MVPQLIIFDCDGVLIDSEIITCRVEAEELTALGISMTTQDVMRRFLGISHKNMLAAIEHETGRQFPSNYETRVAKRVETAMVKELQALPGVREIVADLSIPFCVASSSTPEQLRHTLSITGLHDLFAPNIFSTTEVARGKPAPDLLLHAADKMAVAPECCLVVEDSAAGVRAARAAGMQAVGFVGGSHCDTGHADRLRDEGAARVIDDFADLRPLLTT